MNKYYVVKYSGPFGFIKPWTAVRDSETFSQQFLTPSIVEGIEKKLFPELLKEEGIKKIKRHRLTYHQISQQQEVIQTRGWNHTRKGTHYLFDRPNSIITRGVLLNPTLYLAFDTFEDAQIAMEQHVCLCRNEDILFPQEIIQTTQSEFDSSKGIFAGFELIFEKSEDAFTVGYDRRSKKLMYGSLKIVGTPVKSIFNE